MDKDSVKSLSKTWDFEFRNIRSPYYGLDKNDMLEFVKSGESKHVLTITKVNSWNTDSMKRRFRYICKQFTEAFNLSQKAPCGTVFTVQMVKQYLRSKYFGWVKNEHYEFWCKRVNLAFICSNYHIWWEFMQKQHKESRFLKPRKADSPEELWEFLHFLEQEYFETFGEMIPGKE